MRQPCPDWMSDLALVDAVAMVIGLTARPKAPPLPQSFAIPVVAALGGGWESAAAAGSASAQP